MDVGFNPVQIRSSMKDLLSHSAFKMACDQFDGIQKVVNGKTICGLFP